MHWMQDEYAAYVTTDASAPGTSGASGSGAVDDDPMALDHMPDETNGTTAAEPPAAHASKRGRRGGGNGNGGNGNGGGNGGGTRALVRNVGDADLAEHLVHQGFWACEHCTFNNEDDLEVCEMCAQPRVA